MDPKLRPSFPDIVRQLEGILAGLKVEEMEHECDPLGGDIDKKAASKGNDVSPRYASHPTWRLTPHGVSPCGAGIRHFSRCFSR